VSTRTKPVRIYEADLGPLRLAALAENRSVADVVHSALAEYFDHHREQLVALYDETRAAIAAGDVERLAAGLMRGSQERVDAMLADE
jgi:hypothetical protein